MVRVAEAADGHPRKEGCAPEGRLVGDSCPYKVVSCSCLIFFLTGI